MSNYVIFDQNKKAYVKNLETAETTQIWAEAQQLNLHGAFEWVSKAASGSFEMQPVLDASNDESGREDTITT